MEIKLVLAALLRNFNLVPQVPTAEILVASNLVAAPYPHVKIQTELRR